MYEGRIFEVVILGIVEGLTEFLPISSTGHLIVLIEIFGFPSIPGHVLEVAIQLGAILALCVVYFERLWYVVRYFFVDRGARNFVKIIGVAFLPAAILGFFFHEVIKGFFFSSFVVCVALVLGGVVMLWIEVRRREPFMVTMEDISTMTALKIGLFQCLAFIPGTSRSGATIIGGLLLGLDRRTAIVFSFFLALPTMLGAVSYDVYKNWEVMTWDNGMMIVVGMGTAFVTALCVVKTLVFFVERYGFVFFAWYRIIFGVGLFFYMMT